MGTVCRVVPTRACQNQIRTTGARSCKRIKNKERDAGEAVLSAAKFGAKDFVTGGKRGLITRFDITTMRAKGTETSSLRANVNCIADIDGKLVAIGTDDGLAVRRLGERGEDAHLAGYREQISALAVVPWGTGVGRILTGAKDGTVREWTLAGNLSQWDKESYERVGRSVKRIILTGDGALVASDETLLSLESGEDDDGGGLDSRVLNKVGFRIEDLAVMNESTVVAVGHGQVAAVNLVSGTYTRLFTVSADAKYCAVAKLDDETLCVATQEGKLIAFDLLSAEERGSLDVGMEVRGLLSIGTRLVAYGGSWNGRGRCLSFILWEHVSSKATELELAHGPDSPKATAE